MNHRRYDESLIVGILSGGVVSVVSNAVQLNVIGEGGGIVSVVFALAYALFRYREFRQPEFEQIWEKNRKSVVNSLLSIIDEDFNIMKEVFEKLESNGFNFDTNSGEITLGTLSSVDYNGAKERFEKLPHMQNVLGFITYEQYEAVYNYLKYSIQFIDSLYNQNYQKTS